MRVRVGEVALRGRLGCRPGGGPLPGGDHRGLVHRGGATAPAGVAPAGVVVAVVGVTGLPVPLTRLGVRPGPLGRLRLQRLLGRAHLRQAHLAAGELAGQVRLPPVGAEPGVLGRVRRLRVGEHAVGELAQAVHLGDRGLPLHQPLVAHRLVLAGVRPQLRPVQRHPAHPHQTHLRRQLQGLHEQPGQRVQVSATELRDRPKSGPCPAAR